MSACARGSARANPHPVRVARMGCGAGSELSMEDKKFSLSEAENAAAFSAATLRELQQRAEQALAAGREQATRLEADITRQLDELAQTISSQLSADSDGASQFDSLQAEVDRLSKELQRSHEKCESLRGELEASHKELATVSGTHGEILAERDQLLNRLAEFESQLQSVQAEWQGELEKAQKEWEEEESSLRAERDGVANQLADRASLEHERDELIKKVADLEKGNHATQGEWRSKLEHSQAEWQGERSKLSAERDTLVKELADAAKVERDRDGLIKKVSDLEAGQQSAAGEWRANLERSQSEWQRERSSLCAERDTLTEQLAGAAKLELERDELIKKVADLAKGKDATQGEWRTKLEHSQAEWQAERGQLCAERDTLTKQLADAAKVELDRDGLIKKVAELEAGQHSAKGEWRSKLEHTQAEWEAERKSLCAERDQLVDQLSDHASLALERDELIKKVAELEAGQQTAQLESRTKTEQSRSEWHAGRSKLRTECDELTRKLADHAALELERDELNQKLGALETQQQAAQDEWRQQLLG